MIHCASFSVAPKTACNFGSAILTTVVSSTAINRPKITAIATSHLYSSPRKFPTTGCRRRGAAVPIGPATPPDGWSGSAILIETLLILGGGDIHRHLHSRSQ